MDDVKNPGWWASALINLHSWDMKKKAPVFWEQKTGLKPGGGDGYRGRWATEWSSSHRVGGDGCGPSMIVKDHVATEQLDLPPIRGRKYLRGLHSWSFFGLMMSWRLRWWRRGQTCVVFVRVSAAIQINCRPDQRSRCRRRGWEFFFFFYFFADFGWCWVSDLRVIKCRWNEGWKATCLGFFLFTLAATYILDWVLINYGQKSK